MEIERKFVATRKHKPDGVPTVVLTYCKTGDEDIEVAQSTMFDFGRNGAGPLALARAILLYTFTLLLGMSEEEAYGYSQDMAFSIKNRATAQYWNPDYAFQISVNEVLYYLFLDGLLSKLPKEVFDKAVALDPFELCPSCRVRFLHPNMVRNSVSRRSDEYICDTCGQREAMEDYHARQVG